MSRRVCVEGYTHGRDKNGGRNGTETAEPERDRDGSTEKKDERERRPGDEERIEERERKRHSESEREK